MGKHARMVGATMVAVTLALAVGACSSTSQDSANSSGAESAAVGDVVAGGQDETVAARYRIRTADLTLSVEEADQVTVVADRVVDVVTAAEGFVDDDSRTFGRSASADLVVRVPPDDLDRVLDELGALAVVTQRNVSTEDVTEAYTDLEGRIATMEASIERVRALVAEAPDVVQVAALENELRNRELELESAKGQMRVMQDNVELATLSVRVRSDQLVDVDGEQVDEGPPSPADALSSGWDAFVTVVAWLVAIVLATLPFLVLFGLVVFVALRLRRRRGPKDPFADRPQPPSPPPARPADDLVEPPR